MADLAFALNRAVEMLDSIYEECHGLTRWNIHRAVNTASHDDYLKFVVMVMDLNAKLFVTTELLRGSINEPRKF